MVTDIKTIYFQHAKVMMVTDIKTTLSTSRRGMKNASNPNDLYPRHVKSRK